MKRKKGFTLVEIMIVVLIIGLLAALAVPSFIRARKTSRTNTCINNLRQIEAAKDQWAMEFNQIEGATITDFAEVDQYMKSLPECPIGGTPGGGAGGDYTYGAVGTPPICNQWHATDHNAVLPAQTAEVTPP